MKKLNVLSLFDGISCGYLALQRANIPINKYYASEIDKYAIAISKFNFPDIIQLGDVRKFRTAELPKIDLLLAGFPCQSFSIAGNRKGFEDDRGNLFFDLIRIFKKVKPKYFLFENVASMKKEHRIELDKLIGVESIEINSALVSAQQRKRLYWTNIQGTKSVDLFGNKPIPQPKDKHIYLKDILEKNTNSICCAMRGRNIINGKRKDIKGAKTQQRLECRNDNKTNCITTVQKDNLLFNIPKRIGNIGKGGQGQRIYDIYGKSVCLSAKGGGQGAKTGLYNIKDCIRKLTPIECERLQTCSDNYTSKGIMEGKEVKISNTRRYMALGNGWTVDVIAHILSFIKK